MSETTGYIANAILHTAILHSCPVKQTVHTLFLLSTVTVLGPRGQPNTVYVDHYITYNMDDRGTTSTVQCSVDDRDVTHRPLCFVVDPKQNRFVLPD